jgi:deazaflavin-dependent oxidoreductase (nitroreductase family)
MPTERETRLAQWRAMPKAKTPTWQKPLLKVAASPLGSWFFLNIAPFLDKLLLRAFGGKISTTAGQPTLILQHTGAKSGQVRQTPLLCLPLPQGEFVIVASNGGSTKHPAWYYNLRKQPQVQVTFEQQTANYSARELDAEESAIIWPKLDALYPGYISYRKRAGSRQIPLFVLTPQRS